MVNQAVSSIQLDPSHTSCIGGRTVITCRSCAGNAPRGAICSNCSGRGFSIFICAHCNPTGAAANLRTASSFSSTPESATPSSTTSLSRSSSTSVSSYNDTRPGKPWSRFGDGESGSGGGLQTKSSQPRKH